MLEHGGNLLEAAARHGRPLDQWIDLSTGLNPHPYPVPPAKADAWHRLPQPDPALLLAASRYYGLAALLPVAGTQAAIQALPALRPPSRVTVAAPSYAEHAHNWSKHGHTLRQVCYAQLEASVADSDVLVVCNPNNPTGETVPPQVLLDWADRLSARGGWLVVDEAFGDVAPRLSVTRAAGLPGLVVLRSVGKFFGLAGARVGFVAAEAGLLAALADHLGPWTISGPAQEAAAAALNDEAWQRSATTTLATQSERLRALLMNAHIKPQGTALFQWWREQHAEEFASHMAARGIWVRLFTHAARGIRLGLPGSEAAWQTLENALNEWTQRT